MVRSNAFVNAKKEEDGNSFAIVSLTIINGELFVLSLVLSKLRVCEETKAVSISHINLFISVHINDAELMILPVPCGKADIS